MNLTSGAMVTVEVTDVGPNMHPKHNRVIDLTPAAFRKLAKLEDGIIKVKVEKL